MAIIEDAQGNLIDTENNINFFNRGEELFYPTQDITTYMPETNTPIYQPQGIDTLKFVEQMPMSLNPSIVPNINIAPQLQPNRLEGLNMNRFQGVSDMSIIDETTNDEQDQNYINQVNKNKSGGIADLFRALIGFAVPGANFFLNKGRGAMDGIKSLNQRLRNTDFAKSSSLADYFDARSYGGRDARDRAASQNMREARAIQKQVDMRPSSIQTNQDKGRGNRPGGANYSAPSRPSRASSYRDSSSFGRSFHG